MHINPRRNSGLTPNQACQPRRQRLGEWLGECGQQHPRLWIAPRQMHGAMQRHDRFARPCGTSDTRRPRKAPLYQGTLRGMQKDCPAIPGKIERPAKLIPILQHAEPPLRLRMREGIGSGLGRGGLSDNRLLAHRKPQQRFLRFLWQMGQQIKERGLSRLSHIIHPFFGHPEGHDFQFAQPGEKLWFRRSRRRLWPHHQIFHPFAHFHQLHGAGGGVAFNLAPFRPAIGLVVMIHIGQQQAGIPAMHNQPDIRIHPHRPEILVHRTIQLME